MDARRMRRAALAALALAALALPGAPAHADSRGERPLQLQFDAGGLTLGYHLGEVLYVGVTGQPGYEYGRHYDHRDWRDHVEYYDQRGVDRYDATYAQRNSVEVRYTPWRLGVYFAAGVLSTGTSEQVIKYDERARVVGDNAYTTGLKVRVRQGPRTTGAVGAGYLHVFRQGLSVGGGLLVGAGGTPDPEVTVTDTTGTVSQEDLNKLRRRILRENRGPEVMLHLAAGWNF